jgi:phosphoribosylformylglycinamidine cyclo-ligase
VLLIDYKKSGVDIQTGDQLVSWLQNSDSNATSAFTKKLTLNSDVPDYKKRVVSGIGGFAALFDGRFSTMKKPLLVSCTDGVGTKVKIAAHFKDFSTVGQDLVGMCVNDLICTGGTPLFFLDYYAVGKLDLNSAQSFLTSVKAACEKSHLALIGGETAEMPGVYQETDFDCAGFSVGVVDEEKMWGAHQVQDGDAILGVESSGFHSNGYSLLRKVFEGEFDKYRAWLMEPTRLYVETALTLKNQVQIHAAAHITGGGVENIPRVIPEHLKVHLKSWELPACYQEVQKRAGLSIEEMRSTFNCGIGFVLILPPAEVHTAKKIIGEIGFKTYDLGSVVQRTAFEIESETCIVWD